VEEIISIAHKKNIPVLVDAAQSAGHQFINVKNWDVDFLAFSAHKMFGPMGTGVLYCKEEYGEQVDPFNYGGGGIRNVEFEKTEFLKYPTSLETGTVNIPSVIGLGVAIDFIIQLDRSEMMLHTKEMSVTLKDKLKAIGKIQIVGNANGSGSIVSFNVENIHPHDVASFLANENIAVRAGHHCAQPLHKSMGIPASVRASFSVYNTLDDVDKTIEALVALKKFWS
jgi:cysteine desulfurase/selenocysteine lyase